MHKLVYMVCIAILLNSCAFDDMMTGVNGTLAKTNAALSGKLQSPEKTAENIAKKNNESRSTGSAVLDAECKVWREKDDDFHRDTKRNSYSDVVRAKLENENVKIHGKFFRLCMPNNQMPNKYMDKLGADGLYH